LSNGNDEKVIATLDRIAASGKRANPLSVEDLKSIGTIKSDNSSKSFKDNINPGFAFKSLGFHLRGLFATKTLGLSTSLNFLSWALIGLSYPMYNAFLPTYLSSRSSDIGNDSLNTTYRNNLIVNVCAIFGPVIAGLICDLQIFGRRGTMIVGSLLTMVFMFAYSAVKTSAENLGLSCAVNICLNIYYGTLFAYTPEVLPSAHRATGNGISVAVARAMGTIAPVVAFYSNTATSAPIFVMAAVFLVIAIVSGLFPYEVRGKHSM
jgi:MFS family permease